MKVVAVNGSPRVDGNTAALIKHVFRVLEEEGIETELIELRGKKIGGCVACLKCFANKDGKCAVKSDFLNECVAKMAKADGIILGSPTYFSDVTAEMKALIDRSGMVAMANDAMFKRKVGAGIVATRRTGAIHAFATINLFFLISDMIVVGSNAWNVGFGFIEGEVENDTDGIEYMRNLGENMAWLLKRLHG